jgi:hypothetical protein
MISLFKTMFEPLTIFLLHTTPSNGDGTVAVSRLRTRRSSSPICCSIWLARVLFSAIRVLRSPMRTITVLALAGIGHVVLPVAEDEYALAHGVQALLKQFDRQRVDIDLTARCGAGGLGDSTIFWVKMPFDSSCCRRSSSTCATRSWARATSTRFRRM